VTRQIIRLALRVGIVVCIHVALWERPTLESIRASWEDSDA
jgi:hypothetical protein